MNYLSELLEIERDIGRNEARGSLIVALEHHAKKRQALISLLEKRSESLDKLLVKIPQQEEEFKKLENMCKSVGEQNDKFKISLEFQNAVFDEINQLISIREMQQYDYVISDDLRNILKKMEQHHSNESSKQ